MPFDGAEKKHSTRAGANLAPVAPLTELRSKGDRAYEQSSLGQIIQSLHRDTVNQNLQQRKEIYEVGRLMAALRASKNVMPVRDPIHGAIALIKPLPQKRRRTHVLPLAQVNSSQLTSIWLNSRPQIRVRHFGNTNAAQIQHALIEQMIGHYDKEIFDVWFNQRESLSMMDYGVSIIRPFYDHKLNRIAHLKPIVENRKRTVFESYGICASCGHEGRAEDFERDGLKDMPLCPKCDSADVPALIPDVEIDADEITGVEEIAQGDLNAELLDMPGCNWDMRVLPQDSPWFHYKREISARQVESVLGIEVSREDPNSDVGLAILNAIGRRGGSVEGYGRDDLYASWEQSLPVTVLYEEHYKPECYAGLKLAGDEKTVAGDTIPAGVPLDKLFPDGMLALGFNEMRVIAGIYAEPRRLVGSVYHIQSHSGIGKGTSDAIETSQQLNIAHTAALNTIQRFGAGGGIGYDRDAMTETEAKALIRPGGLVGLNLKGTPYTNVNQAIWQMSHVEANQSNAVMVAQLTNLLNICFQTTDFTAGTATNVDINTLGGQELLAAQNRMRSIAPLSMKGWSRARVFEELIKLFRETQAIGRFFGTGDKFALTKGRFISGKDLPDDIRCDFTLDSEIPTNEFEKRQQTGAMLEGSRFFGVTYVELMNLNPRIAAWWAHKFGVDDMPLFNQHELLVICQDRIDNLKEIVEETQTIAELSGVYPPDEEAAQACVAALKRKVFPFEENHGLKAQLLQEYLDDDEVQEWPPMLQKAVEALILTHMTFDRDSRLRPAMLEQEGQIALAAQAQMAQAAAAQMQAQAAAPAEQQAQEQGLMEEGARYVAGQIADEEKFNREQAAKEQDHARAVELEQIRRMGK